MRCKSFNYAIYSNKAVNGGRRFGRRTKKGEKLRKPPTNNMAAAVFA